MNAESTFVRSSRPAVGAAPGGDGLRLAVLVLALPLRLAATALGRRLLAAVVLSAVLVTAVALLYRHADDPARAPASLRAAKVAAAGPAPAGGRGIRGTLLARGDTHAPRSSRTARPEDAAAAWFAEQQRVAVDRVRTLQQRRISTKERQVLVVAEASGDRMPSAYVTVRKGAAGWAVK
jgi:hypothetical protein